MNQVIKLRFYPEAWVNDYAFEVDPEGGRDWEIPRDFVKGDLPEDNSYGSDYLRDHPNAPQWVKDWTGPFWVRILNREELETDPEPTRKIETSNPSLVLADFLGSAPTVGVETTYPVFADPIGCPFCLSNEIRFTNTLQAREVDDASEEVHLDEYQCMNCARNFWT